MELVAGGCPGCESNLVTGHHVTGRRASGSLFLMPLSSNHRTDRRRRAIRESIAADADFAVESVKATKRARRTNPKDDEAFVTGYRDPGYSQAVRQVAQQRLVQLIPVRPMSLALAIGIAWCGWGALILAHYVFHVRSNEHGRSPILFLQLFDIRSPHSIANWLTCQLWMLTALVAWMIFRIRQHKLDDFRAKYRVWAALAGVAAFSSFDASTSCLYLLGQSIDGWTRSEIGYGGWPLVLATYATLVGLLGIRLSSELKSTPAALVLWFGGLLAWACAALLGTGLLKLEWSLGTIDIVVGACWLGGVLAVFQAAGLVLRHCYIHAQKRFLERAVLARSKSAFRLPSFGAASASDADVTTTEEDDTGLTPKRSMMAAMAQRVGWPWRSASDQDDVSESDDVEDSNLDDDEEAAAAPKSAKNPPKSGNPPASQRSEPEEPKRPKRLFGLIPHRQERNEQLAGDEPLRTDDGGEVDEGLTKRPGWFGWRRSREASTANVEPQADAKLDSKSRSMAAASAASSASDTASDATPKRSWLPKFGRRARNPDDVADVDAAVKSDPSPKAKTTAAPEVKNSASKSNPPTQDASDADSAPAKRGWLNFGKRKPASEGGDVTASDSPKAEKAKAPKKEKPADAAASDTATKPGGWKSRLTGWFDGLKLKPPVDTREVPATPRKDAASQSASGKAAADSNPAQPVPVSSNARPLPSTQSKPAANMPEDEDGDDEDYGGNARPLSKAERKRLRRMQQDRDVA